MNNQDAHNQKNSITGNNEDTEIQKEATAEQLDEVQGGWTPEHTFKSYSFKLRLGPEHA